MRRPTRSQTIRGDTIVRFRGVRWWTRNLLALDDVEEVDRHDVVDAKFHEKVQPIVAEDAGFNASVLEVHAFEAQKPDKIPADFSMSWRTLCGAGL